MTRNPLLLAVTSRVPHSTTEEAFVQEELETIMAQGVPMIVAPMRLAQRSPNAAARASGLVEKVLAQPLISPTVIAGAFRTLAYRPLRVLRGTVRLLGRSGGRRNLVTNALSIPKALWLADVARKHDVKHIHAYWYAHTSSAAWLANFVTGIPWSATGYRWDIDAENALQLKAGSASFLRVADELGLRQMTEKLAAWRLAPELAMVRTGVRMPDLKSWCDVPLDLGTICCAGAFVEKKGHAYLLDAAAELVAQGHDLEVHLMGDGPLRAELEVTVQRLGLSERVTFHGIVALETLREFLSSRRPIFVLPSIRADDGQEEGIPVVLIEAMANGCPVVSTKTGSIPTLILDGCGLLVGDRDAAALASSISDLMADRSATEAMTLRARDRVEAEFARDASAAKIVELMRETVA